jgi:hypothetical protein
MWRLSMSQTGERVSRFARNFVAALGHCVSEELELIVPVGLIFACLVIFATIVQIVYEVLFDPNSADVSARLASLSIDPSNWV